ncbi:hypothetical protein [Billgrantia bachuensis]|uniref:Uncharacterized protein n=1 Tax=Billgrantia bachuensis TaxID=2717286 RepID=A0ABX0PPQ5_9GAMM|nr:hypothetical protein [Halomonas bachuensis]NIC05271.1 hypothetical protein [Halomonas bachuensis]
MRNLIGLAARTFDPQGALLLPGHGDNDTGSLRRRVTRAATLDGGVAITNRGYSAADRTLTLSLAGQPLALVERARRLLRLHGNVTVTLADGAFTGTPSEYNERRQELVVLISGTA